MGRGAPDDVYEQRLGQVVSCMAHEHCRGSGSTGNGRERLIAGRPRGLLKTHSTAGGIATNLNRNGLERYLVAGGQRLDALLLLSRCSAAKLMVHVTDDQSELGASADAPKRIQEADRVLAA